MKLSIFKSIWVLIALVSLFLVSCGDDDETEEMMAPQNIVEIASADARFSTLVAALQQANLVSVLEGGEYTVFAPTNDAFQALLNNNPAWNSLSDIPNDVLTSVLLYHVVGGTVKSTSLSTGYVPSASPSTAAGSAAITSDLYISVGNTVMINGDVTVTTADIEASNGVIHVVDKVITLPTVVTFAATNPMFTSLVAALTRSDMADYVGTLSGMGPFTVFAPNNDAFEALLNDNDDWTSLEDIPTATLKAVLEYHVVATANVRAVTLEDGQTVETFGGSSFTIDLDNGPAIVDGQNRTAKIIATDVQANNGVVHVIDTVIIP